MLRFAGSLLLLSAAFAAALPPAAKPLPKANSTDRLEELVSDMAIDQGGPRPRAEAGEMFIVEGGERRRLGACSCAGGYRNGAAPGSPVCAKREGGASGRVCYPTMGNGLCSDRDATLCGSGAAPSPQPLSLIDAEEVVQEAYLNVNMQIHNPQTTSATQLPSPDAFAAAIAQLTQTSARRVSVLTTWGAPTGVRSATVVTQGSSSLTTATVHATIAVRNAERRDQLVSLLQLHDVLPAINGVTFNLVGVQVFEQASHPLVCTRPGDEHDPNSANLLAQLVDLKRQEVELMRQAVAQVQQHASMSADWTALLGRVATRLGMSTPSA